MRHRHRLLVLVVAGGLLSASGTAGATDTLSATPDRAPVGAAVRLSYGMDALCGKQERAVFFFDATPIGTVPVDQRTCRAALTWTVPPTSCTEHRLTAAWHYPGSEQQLYGQATLPFLVTGGCSARSAPPRPAPRPSVSRAAPSSAPSPAALPSSLAPAPTPTPGTTAAAPVAVSPPVSSSGGIPRLLPVGLGALAVAAAVLVLRRARRR